MLMHPPPGGGDFMRDAWRCRPVLLPALLSQSVIGYFTMERFREWCSTHVRARVYARTESTAPGTATAHLINSAADGLVLLQHFAERAEPLTLLLNGVDEVDSRVRELQDSFGIPYDWRRGDTVATLSMTGAGIGYHAGREDGFVVQTKGRREWAVWDQSVLTDEYRQSLCGSMRDVPPDQRSSAEPLLRCELAPGDALYIPALFPHEGVTLDTSISLSVAWQGIAASDVWMALRDSSRQETVTPRSALCRLLPDPPPDKPAASFLHSAIELDFQSLEEGDRPPFQRVQAFVDSLLEHRLRDYKFKH